MPAFAYQALDDAGKTQRGVLQGDTARAVRASLRERGLNPLEVTPVTEAQQQGRSMMRRGLSGAQLALLTRQLATLLKAGVALVEALAALVDQVEKERLKRVVSDIKQKVNEGASLADGMQAHVKVFGNLYVNMVRAGEHSGALDAVLLRLAEFTEGQRSEERRVGKEC